MSIFSDIITDLFKNTVENTISTFQRYLSTQNIINVLNNVIKKLEEENQEINKNEITCQGCLEEQANQQAHMDYGGCLYEEV